MEILWLIPALPFAGFVLLVGLGRRLGNRLAGSVGVASVAGSALICLLVTAEYLLSPPAGDVFVQRLWSWIQVAHFQVEIAFYLDALSLVMSVVITLVGFLIHLYAVDYMKGEEDTGRFFAYMNLFMGCMLVLVLADNLLFLYLGWEGVGLCSYLLIGFWYRDPWRGAAARKAFIVTRVGDTGIAVGMFLIFTQLGTLQIQQVMHQASQQWPPGSSIALAVSLLLLCGAVGKSAQLPLQTWLPDAMAGPTPVSALIHAATMVTAGFYLIARTHVLFALAPAAQIAVAWVGAITLLVGGVCALAQRDIKRVLAYSTMSQVGYMFLALGAGAYSAAVFHFMTHAFFKALLFLAAGAVIVGLRHEQDIFKMGGLRRQVPLVFWSFLAGAASLAALPLVTSGFYSKDMILWQVWSFDYGGRVLWAVGLAGAFITGLYTFRMVFLVFFGSARSQVDRKPGVVMQALLVALAILSIVAGFVEIPKTLGRVTWLSGFLKSAFSGLTVDSIGHQVTGHLEATLQIITSLVVLAGIWSAYWLYLRRPQALTSLHKVGLVNSFSKLGLAGLGFDALYRKVFVLPFLRLARTAKDDWVDSIYLGLARLMAMLHRLMSRTQTGKVRHYAVAIALGAAVILAMVMLS